MDSEVQEVLQREILERCNEEEREAVERWFKSFQAIGLSKLNGCLWHAEQACHAHFIDNCLFRNEPITFTNQFS